MHLETQHKQELCEAKKSLKALEINQNLLTCQLQESQKQIEEYTVRIFFTIFHSGFMNVQSMLNLHFLCTFQFSLEALTAEKDGLQKNLSVIQESHNVQLKQNNMRHEENLKRTQQQVG